MSTTISLSLRRAAARLACLAAGVALVSSRLPAVAAQNVSDTVLQGVEIDIIYPRNESYGYAEVYRDWARKFIPDVLPIAFAVQNVAQLMPDQYDVTLVWDISASISGLPSIDIFATGTFNVSDIVRRRGSMADPLILVDGTNITEWAHKAEFYKHLVLGAYMSARNTTIECTRPYNSLVVAQLTFGLHNQAGYLDTYDTYLPLVNISRAPACPAEGGFMDVVSLAQPTAVTKWDLTSTCSHIFSASVLPITTKLTNDVFPRGTPCAVTVDAALKSSIETEAWSIAYTSYLSANHLTSPQSTLSANGVVVAARPTLAPVLAAVAAVYVYVVVHI